MRTYQRRERKGLFMFIFLLFKSLFKNAERMKSIIGKNFKVILRSKSSALVIIFGPLIVIFLVGIAFSNSTIYDVNIGVYSDSYSTLSDNIMKNLQNENYLIKKIDTREQCINGVKTGENNICLIFSGNMNADAGSSNKITFYVDYTRVNLVYAIMDNI
jgi:hypothetical protein